MLNITIQARVQRILLNPGRWADVTLSQPIPGHLINFTLYPQNVGWVECMKLLQGQALIRVGFTSGGMEIWMPDGMLPYSPEEGPYTQGDGVQILTDTLLEGCDPFQLGWEPAYIEDAGGHGYHGWVRYDGKTQ